MIYMSLLLLLAGYAVSIAAMENFVAITVFKIFAFWLPFGLGIAGAGVVIWMAKTRWGKFTGAVLWFLFCFFLWVFNCLVLGEI